MTWLTRLNILLFIVILIGLVLTTNASGNWLAWPEPVILIDTCGDTPPKFFEQKGDKKVPIKILDLTSDERAIIIDTIVMYQRCAAKIIVKRKPYNHITIIWRSK